MYHLEKTPAPLCPYPMLGPIFLSDLVGNKDASDAMQRIWWNVLKEHSLK